MLSGGRTRSQTYVEEEPGEIIEESVETDEESEAEVTSYKNFCDIDESNIIEGGRTRSQRALVACSELNRTILNYKLALLSHEKDDPNKKGYHSYKEAVQADPQWKEEYMKEIKKLETIGELTVVVRPKGQRCLPFVEVLTQKKDNISGNIKRKVRLAVRGDLQRNKPEHCYSPAAGMMEIRLFISILKKLGAFVIQGDCPSAYLNGRLDEKIYLYLPEGHPKKEQDNKYVYACSTSVYGLAVAGRVWYYKFKNIVEGIGFKVSERAPTLFVLKGTEDKSVYLQLYVDDFLLGSKDVTVLKEVKKKLFKLLKVKFTEKIEKFVGVEIENKREGIFLHQQGMIRKLAEEYRLSQGFATPMLLNLKWNEDSSVLTDVKKLQKLFGELNYISCLSRPDIAFSVNRIARKLQKPTKEVFRAAKRILSYVACTSDLGLWIPKEGGYNIEVFSDASFADIVEQKYRSTGGYAVFVGQSLISWKSKKLKFICTSTAESEYLGLFVAAKESLFIAYLLEEVFMKKVFPIKMYCDNKAVVDILQEAGAAELTKYMATKFYKLQEWISRELIEVHKIASEENIADGFTKIPKNYKFFKDSVLKQRGSALPRNIVVENKDEYAVGGVGNKSTKEKQKT